jgi:hypothetical protein
MVQMSGPQKHSAKSPGGLITSLIPGVQALEMQQVIQLQVIKWLHFEKYLQREKSIGLEPK